MRLTLLETQRQSAAAIDAAKIARDSLQTGNESFAKTLTEMQAQSRSAQSSGDAAKKSAEIAEAALNPDFRFECGLANLLVLSDAFIHAGSDVRDTPRRHTPSG